ncbi:uncharacterized protein LOC134833577 [Culicoides brevitarsis]|uniref:uncharacterized protein LOC134833577 n=1 Tax=Culicoides brevitarsis TaxID=469753 RepID=UPI00307C0917
MSENDDEVEIIGDGPKDSPLKKADSDDNLYTAGSRVSALDVAWNFNDPEADAALTEFKKRGLLFKDLSSLCDKDLELLGVESSSMRDTMLQYFRQLPKQDPDYEQVLKETDMEEYSTGVLSNISEHINNLKMSLMAAQARFKVQPPEDLVLPDENIPASTLVLKTIEKMMQQCDEMHFLVDEIVSDEFGGGRNGSGQGVFKKIFKSVMWIGGLTLAAYAGQKIIRAKLK